MSLETISILACIVIIAGIIRGFTGFGFAAVAVVGMNIFLTPQQSIPVVLGLDILCCAPLIRQAIKQGDKPTFKHLTLGSLIGIPFGFGDYLRASLYNGITIKRHRKTSKVYD